MHKLHGGSGADNGDPTDLDAKLKELSNSVIRLEKLSAVQAKKLKELEDEKQELKSDQTGATSPSTTN